MKINKPVANCDQSGGKMKNTKHEIDFSNAIITPLKQWVNIDLDLDDDIVTYLNALSEKTNQSIDNIITHILTDLFSEHLELSNLSPKTLRAIGKKNRHIILLNKNKPFARIEIINQDEEEDLFKAVDLPNPKVDNPIKSKMPAPQYDYECASEAFKRV